MIDKICSQNRAKKYGKIGHECLQLPRRINKKTNYFANNRLQSLHVNHLHDSLICNYQDFICHFFCNVFYM